MMHSEYFILDLLQGRINVDGEDIRLRQYPLDRNLMPCLTIDTSAGEPVVKHKYTSDKQGYDIILTEHRATPKINVWCLDEDTRQEIIQQVSNLIYQAMSFHCTYCSNYDNGECMPLETECYAQEYENFSRGNKGQCPLLTHEGETLPYQSVFDKHGVILKSFRHDPAYDLDELEEKEAILRSVIELSFNYKKSHYIGGVIPENLINETEVINYD